MSMESETPAGKDSAAAQLSPQNKILDSVGYGFVDEALTPVSVATMFNAAMFTGLLTKFYNVKSARLHGVTYEGGKVSVQLAVPFRYRQLEWQLDIVQNHDECHQTRTDWIASCKAVRILLWVDITGEDDRTMTFYPRVKDALYLP